MSVRSAVGNLTHTIQDNLAIILNIKRTEIENIVGSATTSLSNIWSGGFTGMSETGIAELKTQLINYCQDIQDIISDFDQTGDITSALKGEVQNAAYEFIAAIKVLLQAYVSQMKKGIAEADEAYQNFVKAAQSISQDVESAAQDIRSQARDINIESSGNNAGVMTGGGGIAGDSMGLK